MNNNNSFTLDKLAKDNSVAENKISPSSTDNQEGSADVAEQSGYKDVESPSQTQQSSSAEGNQSLSDSEQRSEQSLSPSYEGEQSPSDEGEQSPSDQGDQTSSGNEESGSDGYGTQSDGSYYDEAIDALFIGLVKQIPEVHLRDYEEKLKELVRHPVELGLEADNEFNTRTRQEVYDR